MLRAAEVWFSLCREDNRRMTGSHVSRRAFQGEETAGELGVDLAVVVSFISCPYLGKS